MTIILDTNIVLDILLKRSPFYEASHRVLAEAIKNDTDVVLTTNTITDIYYILSKNDRVKAKPVLEQFVRLIRMVEVAQNDIMAAFASEMDGFEDAVVMAVAVRIGADYIVTRNTTDYKKSSVPAITPEDFLLKLLSENRS